MPLDGWRYRGLGTPQSIADLYPRLNREFTDLNAALQRMTRNVGPVLNVLDFGAQGNGLTGAATAVQQAVNTITSAGGTLYFPAGSYLLSATISVPTDRVVLLQGEVSYSNGATLIGGSQLKRAAGFTSGPLVKQLGPASPTYGLQCQDLVFNGAGLAGDLLELNHTNQAYLRNVVFTNTLGNGLYAPQLWNAALVDCRWLACGKSDGTAWGLKLDSTADGGTNTVLVVNPYMEAMNGGAIWMGDTASAVRCSNVTLVGGKIEQSTNAISVPFTRLNKVADITIADVLYVNGLHNGATHVEVVDGNRVTLRTQHTTSTTVDSENPQYFVDVQSAVGCQISGRYFRGAGNTGAQVHVANTVTEWRVDPNNVHRSSLNYDLLYGSGTVLKLSTSGPSHYYTTQGALGVGSTILGPVQGTEVTYVANGNTGTILAAGQDGQEITVINEGGTNIAWNATDDTSLVKNGAGNAVVSATAGRFVWDSRLGAAGLWVRCI